MEDFQKEIERLNTVLQNVPDSYSSLYELGEIFLKLGSFKEAAACFEKAFITLRKSMEKKIPGEIPDMVSWWSHEGNNHREVLHRRMQILKMKIEERLEPAEVEMIESCIEILSSDGMETKRMLESLNAIILRTYNGKV